MKPIITRIRHINLLVESPLYNAMYRHVLVPLTNGVVSVPNRNTIKVVYNDQEYIIRTDMPFIEPQYHIGSDVEFMERCETKINEFIINLRSKAGLWVQAGIGVFKELTDTNDLEVALSLSNVFRKQGLAVGSVKVVRDGEEVMEYRIVSDFGSHKFITTDSDEMFTFIGTLANTFTRSYNRPDPNWFKGLDKADFQF